MSCRALPNRSVVCAVKEIATKDFEAEVLKVRCALGDLRDLNWAVRLSASASFPPVNCEVSQAFVSTRGIRWRDTQTDPLGACIARFRVLNRWWHHAASPSG